MKKRASRLICREDMLLWALSQPLTPMRLAALGGIGFAALCREQANTLPQRSNRKALEDLASDALYLSDALRYWDEMPFTKIGRGWSEDAADICAGWQLKAMKVHQRFTPRVVSWPPKRIPERGRDAYGFPNVQPTPGWPMPSDVIPFPTPPMQPKKPAS